MKTVSSRRLFLSFKLLFCVPARRQRDAETFTFLKTYYDFRMDLERSGFHGNPHPLGHRVFLAPLCADVCCRRILSIVFTPKNLVCMQIIPSRRLRENGADFALGTQTSAGAAGAAAGSLSYLTAGRRTRAKNCRSLLPGAQRRVFVHGEELCEMIENKEICKSLHIVLY
jgi:hypothetical protein